MSTQIREMNEMEYYDNMYNERHDSYDSNNTDQTCTDNEQLSKRIPEREEESDTDRTIGNGGDTDRTNGNGAETDRTNGNGAGTDRTNGNSGDTDRTNGNGERKNGRTFSDKSKNEINIIINPYNQPISKSFKNNSTPNNQFIMIAESKDQEKVLFPSHKRISAKNMNLKLNTDDNSKSPRKNFMTPSYMGDNSLQSATINNKIKKSDFLKPIKKRRKITDKCLKRLKNPNRKKSNSTKVLGTSNYMSPEIIKGDIDQGASDYWALGIIIYYIYAKKLPFESDEAFEIFDNIVDYKIDWEILKNSNIDKDLLQIVQGLLTYNQDKRLLEIKKLRHSNYFKGKIK